MIKLKGVIFLSISIVLVALCCSGPDLDQQILTVEVPLHLEEHLEAARIEDSEKPQDLLTLVEWRFDEPQPGWKVTTPRSFPAEIRPAGAVLFEHFCEPLAPMIRALKPNELKTFFADFDIEFYEETQETADWGGPGSRLVRMLARKKF